MVAFTWVITTVLYIVFDVAYFLRAICHAIFAKAITTARSKRPLLQESQVWGICLSTDMDFQWHMNNARYLRECDFGRIDLWLRNGVFNAVQKLGGGITLAASTIRYRKSLRIFDSYIIKSKIICWDEKAFFLEQQIVRKSDDFVCATVLAKQSLIKLTPEEVIMEVTGENTKSPKFPDEVDAWEDYNEISSEKLKKELKKEK